MTTTSRDEVRDLFADGLAAAYEIGGRFGPDDWERTACGTWSAADTARHLLGVSRWYHEWLDRAVDGNATPPFRAADLDAHAREGVDALAAVAGADALDSFADSASDYLDRLPDHWDTPYGFPFGTVTAGLHCGVAATEWHLHAWDLSTVADPLHTPAHPDRLFIAAGRCVAAAEGGVKGAALRVAVPLASRRAPWTSLLARSGRSAPT